MHSTRRSILRAAVAVPAIGLPNIVHAAAQTTLRFAPVIELAQQQQVAGEIQRLAWDEVLFMPIGEYKQPTAYRTSITGMLDGTAVFWNVRSA